MTPYRRKVPMMYNVSGLACYKGPMSPRQLGSYAQLGQAESAMSAVQEVLNFFKGLFGKDPNKTNYDNARQQIWTAFGNVVNKYAPTINNLSATKSFAQEGIAAVDTFISQMTALTNEYRGKIDAAWIEPRYHDFFDFMTKVRNDWEAALPKLSGFALPSIPGLSPSTSNSLLPILLAGGAMLLLRR